MSIDRSYLTAPCCDCNRFYLLHRSFRRLQRQRGAPSYQYPDAGGESITLCGPSNYKLFVRHCSACIGLMQLVRSWNTEIETAFRQMADFQIVDAQIAEFKKLIANMTRILADKEAEIVRLETKNTELEVANAWFDKWSYLKESAEREEVILEQKRALSNLAGMAHADIESTAYNYALRMDKRIAGYEDIVRDLKTTIKKEKQENENLARNRLALCDALRACEIKLENKTNALEFQARERDADAANLAALQSKFDHVTSENAKLQAALDLKEREYDELRTSSADKLESMRQQVESLSAEYNAKEAEVDMLRDDLRSKKVLTYVFLNIMKYLSFTTVHLVHSLI